MQTPTTKKPRRTSWIRPSKMPPEETDAILAPPDEQESTLVSSEKPPHASRDFGAWDIRGFQDAMSASSERPPWVIEDLLLEETGTLVSAHPHAMKSLSWLGACLEAIVKKRVWGHFAAPNVQSTLFIETEDPPWLVEARIRGIAKGLGLEKTANVPGFHYACVGPFDLPKTEPYIKGLIEEIRPSFLVLSTLQNLLAGRQWKEQGDMQPIMASIIRISRLSPTVLLTHSPWNPKERRAAGSVTQTANFVTTAHYQKVTNHKTKETFVHVVMDSKAGAQETNFSLKLLTEGDPREPSSVRGLEYAGEGWPKGLGKAAVLAAIEDDPDASAKEIAERTGMSTRYVQKITSETSRGQPRKGRK